jgi:hypothetical protein
MFTSAKEKARKIAFRASITGNIVAVLVLFAVIGATKAHWLHADFVPPSVSFGGGGTEQRAEAQQQLAALQAALPVNALTPSPKPQEGPAPQRKPVVR